MQRAESFELIVVGKGGRGWRCACGGEDGGGRGWVGGSGDAVTRLQVSNA